MFSLFSAPFVRRPRTQLGNGAKRKQQRDVFRERPPAFYACGIDTVTRAALPPISGLFFVGDIESPGRRRWKTRAHAYIHNRKPFFRRLGLRTSSAREVAKTTMTTFERRLLCQMSQGALCCQRGGTSTRSQSILAVREGCAGGRSESLQHKTSSLSLSTRPHGPVSACELQRFFRISRWPTLRA
ncbi:hypothetical protein HPB51_015323 [Rhipicephalus microplus]|uniref:Uncharacterized protein n=1 Tax=Rhipicephalus microplus TaxID=6941 RepID=A0A9J6DGT0_RHIMP|nr:hypothetical protein HPB51_015323 [Rhipicephalus microplus]